VRFDNLFCIALVKLFTAFGAAECFDARRCGHFLCDEVSHHTATELEGTAAPAEFFMNPDKRVDLAA
jgi:hypothetical protein